VLILGLDLAVRTGFCLGEPGQIPRSGTVRLKKPADEWTVAPGNLGCFLRDLLVMQSDRPDIIIYEAPLPFFAAHADQRQRSIESLVLPPSLVGATLCIGGTYGIPCVGYQANTIRKAFIGRASAGGRDETKNAVIRQAVAEKLVPSDCRDDNRADAVATWMFGCLKHARYRPPVITMFGEAAQ
jgi:hypothetical protein